MASVGSACAVEPDRTSPVASDNAAKLGVAVQSLAQFYAEHSAAPAGLVLGYANHNETQLVTGVRTLARALPRKRVR